MRHGTQSPAPAQLPNKQTNMCCHRVLSQLGSTRMFSKNPAASRCNAVSLSMQKANGCRNVLCFCSIPEVSCCLETSWIQGRWIIDMPALGRKSKARLKKGKGPLSGVNCTKMQNVWFPRSHTLYREIRLPWSLWFINYQSRVIQRIPLASLCALLRGGVRGVALQCR